MTTSTKPPTPEETARALAKVLHQTLDLKAAAAIIRARDALVRAEERERVESIIHSGLDPILAAKDAEIAELQHQLRNSQAGYENAVSEMGKMSDGYEARLAELRVENERLKADCEDCERDVARRRDSAAEPQSQLAAANARIGELEQLAAVAGKLERRKKDEGYTVAVSHPSQMSAEALESGAASEIVRKADRRKPEAESTCKKCAVVEWCPTCNKQWAYDCYEKHPEYVAMVRDRIRHCPTCAALIEAGRKWLRFERLWQDHAEWSQATFGADTERGPIGPLKHLVKEALEAQEKPTDIYEYADCELLTQDARRRGGFTLEKFITACEEKLAINKTRTYPRPGPNELSEHVRGVTPCVVHGHLHESGEANCPYRWAAHIPTCPECQAAGREAEAKREREAAQ